MCKDCCKKGSCTTYSITKILVIIGGVNWGLVGLGMLLGNIDWNVVKMILGSVPVLEAVVYVLTGVAAVMMIFGCKCGKCMSCVSCALDEKKGENKDASMEMNKDTGKTERSM